LAAQTPVPEVRVSSRPYISASPYSLRVETRLVDVGVVVRDSHGQAIAGLKQSDFELLDNGKERPISAFSVDTARARAKAPSAPKAAPGPRPAVVPPPETGRPPRFLVLFFDDANTNTGDMTHAQIAARRFVKEALIPGDRVAVVTSSNAHVLDFTTDTAKMVDTIDRLKAHVRVPESGLVPCPRITPYQGFLISSRMDPTATWAAVDEVYACADRQPPPHTSSLLTQMNPIIQSVRTQADQTWERVRIVSQSSMDSLDATVEFLGKMPGTRVVVLVSSGFIGGTLEQQQDVVVDHALRAGVVINALDAKGLFVKAPGRPFGESATFMKIPVSTFIFESTSAGSRLEELAAPMATFAASTGGLFFHNNNDLDLAFRQVGLEPEVTYHLGFAPEDMAADGKYHKLKVRLVSKNPDIIQARPGYFAPAHNSGPEKKAPGNDARTKLDSAVRSEEILTGFQAAVVVKPGPPVSVMANVDVAGLKFPERDGRHLQHLTFVAALLDAQGNIAAAKEGAMDLALTSETLARMALTGLNANLTLEAPPGAYRLREVIQEAVSGRITTTLQTVQVPVPR
jgi:VWFA-related protein